MTYDAICCYPGINRVDAGKVNRLAKSMRENGWIGAPILYTDYGLVTGSHRLAALKLLEADIGYDGSILFADIAEDVTEIVNAYCDENGITADEIDYSNIGPIFRGTEIEKWADMIEEW